MARLSKKEIIKRATDYIEFMKKEIKESLKLKGEQLDLSYDNEYDEAFDKEECL